MYWHPISEHEMVREGHLFCSSVSPIRHILQNLAAAAAAAVSNWTSVPRTE
jgi:hypothetical protein